MTELVGCYSYVHYENLQDQTVISHMYVRNSTAPIQTVILKVWEIWFLITFSEEEKQCDTVSWITAELHFAISRIQK